MQTFDPNQLASFFSEQEVCLISCLSFEERSLTSARILSRSHLKSWLSISNTDIEIDSHAIITQASKIAMDSGIDFNIYYTSKKRPTTAADQLIAALDRAITSKQPIILDITTMTHEVVLILVAALEEVGNRDQPVTVIYNLAGQYSANESDRGRKWISRGIHGVRSVLGYPGFWAPGADTTLIALPGFDLERVLRVYEYLEPSRLVVGIANPSFERHQWLYEQNHEVASQLLSGVKGSVFEYTALDPIDVMKKVNLAASQFSGNIAILPLNSKPSTLAVGVLARTRPHWQLCYAPALVYNFSYAEPSDVFMLTDYKSLKNAVSPEIENIYAF